MSRQLVGTRSAHACASWRAAWVPSARPVRFFHRSCPLLVPGARQAVAFGPPLAPLVRRGLRHTPPPRAQAATATAPSRPPAVRPLPPPPQTCDLANVLPYLLRLALSETRMYWRLGLALVLMVCSKSAGLATPILMKKAVNALSAGASDVALHCVLALGAANITNHLCKEAQHPTFTPLSQAVSRRVAVNTFAHILGLDFHFHLNRRTGKLSRILERGTRSVQMLYRAIIFTFLPTTVELAFVCGLLAHSFNASVAVIVGATFAAYVTWTLFLTQRATAVRKKVNEYDNKVTSKAVDALINYETVTLFGNQRLEVAQYSGHLTAFQQASQATERLSAMLNAGQAVILGCGMMAVLSAVVLSGTTSAGDLVMVNGLLLQLWAPLQFLGWFYRELRQSLVDMEEYFSILTTSTHLPDGTLFLPATPPPPSAEFAAPAASAASSSRNGSSNGNGTSSSNGNGTSSTRSSSTSTSSSGRHSSSGSMPSSTGTSSSHQGQAATSHDTGNGVRDVGVAGSSTSRSNSSSMDDDTLASSSRGRSSECSTSGSSSSVGGLRLELQGVQFGYSGDQQVLRGLTLTAEPGQSIALVGKSGSGKSTVLKLLARLWDVQEGRVLLNGVDVRDVRLDSLRGAVGVVPQDTVLFYDTILENIRYGRPDASDEECKAAAVAARLHDTVSRMPDGYNTVVGERGLRLSGGEKQRVAIARAFLQRPRLLLCDEATSALDSTTEAQIMTSLTELARDRTSVFVAHRLSTIRNCDKIIVLEAGRMVEEGTHDELMAMGGTYSAMYNLQAAEDAEQQGVRRGGRGSPARQGNGILPEEDHEDDKEASVVVAALT